jgi:phosphohistidine phosphatase
MEKSTWLDNCYIQSAVIPYRRTGDDLEILLIRSRRDKRWVVPKGIVEPGMTQSASAAKEALEEAGIEGDLEPRALGVFEYEKWGGVCVATVFAMAVTVEHKSWLEDFRHREWMSVETAARRVREPKLQQIIWGLDEWLRSDGGRISN